MALGVTGYLKIDRNGDRETDFSLWDMDPETGAFRVSSHIRQEDNALPEWCLIFLTPLHPTALSGICLFFGQL